MGLFKSSEPVAPPEPPTLRREDLSQAFAQIHGESAVNEGVEFEYLDENLSDGDRVLAAAPVSATRMDREQRGAIVLTRTRAIVAMSPRDKRGRRTTDEVNVEVIDLADIMQLYIPTKFKFGVKPFIKMSDGGMYINYIIGPSTEWGEWFVEYIEKLMNKAKLA